MIDSQQIEWMFFSRIQNKTWLGNGIERGDNICGYLPTFLFPTRLTWPWAAAVWLCSWVMCGRCDWPLWWDFPLDSAAGLLAALKNLPEYHLLKSSITKHKQFNRGSSHPIIFFKGDLLSMLCYRCQDPGECSQSRNARAFKFKDSFPSWAEIDYKVLASVLELTNFTTCLWQRFTMKAQYNDNNCIRCMHM